MKKILWCCFFIALALCGAWSLEWTLGLSAGGAADLQGSEDTNSGGAGERSFVRPLVLRNGDVFTLRIRSEDPAWCYVIAQDSAQAVHVLNNSALDQGGTLTIGPLELTLPSGDEIFYIIVSGEPQKTLEGRIRFYEKNGNSQKAADDLVGEVLKIRREVSRLKERPEMPVSMGGSFRSDEFVRAIKYSGTDCYVKSIVVRH
ncbi:MAG: DUF4384 domain-containing protein [Treponema sp.]|jgi:hypothetical protein|nr:DUF4384 domain-containing protein [Treponema sp.]